jgi:hypothetical protein
MGPTQQRSNDDWCDKRRQNPLLAEPDERCRKLGIRDRHIARFWERNSGEIEVHKMGLPGGI